MISKKDAEIIVQMRNNARKRITDISKAIKTPLTTVYDRVRQHQRRGIVKKHVSLLNFSKLGFSTNAVIALSVGRERIHELEEYLSAHPNINTLYRVNSGFDFFAEVIFEDASRLQEFVDETQAKFNIEKPGVFTVVNELKKEEFLAKPYPMELGR